MCYAHISNDNYFFTTFVETIMQTMPVVQIYFTSAVILYIYVSLFYHKQANCGAP